MFSSNILIYFCIIKSTIFGAFLGLFERSKLKKQNSQNVITNNFRNVSRPICRELNKELKYIFRFFLAYVVLARFFEREKTGSVPYNTGSGIFSKYVIKYLGELTYPHQWKAFERHSLDYGSVERHLNSPIFDEN